MTAINSSEFQEILGYLLSDEKLIIPTKTTSDYHDELIEKFEIYLMRLKELKTTGELTNWIKENIDNIEKSTSNIRNALEKYLAGNAGKAYQEIEKYFEFPIVINNLRLLKLSLNNYSDLNRNYKSLYRVRCSPSKISKRKEMFHLPFKKRHLVGNQRYSIAGVPSLYLGSSIFICWEEMGRPNLNTMHISAFKTKKELNVIDFSFSLDSLKYSNNIENMFPDEKINNEKYKAYIALFPIIMSCSFNRKYHDGIFNTEYIIPNLVLQWVSEEKSQFHGIKYTSTKVKNKRHSEYIHNFVFPPRKSEYQKEGYCNELSVAFSLTAPSSWEVLDSIVIDYHLLDQSSDIDIDEELNIKYGKTKFSQIEHKINGIGKFKTIS